MSDAVNHWSWTPAMDAEIRARYFIDRASAIADDLGRPRSAIFKRAGRLGLLKVRPWSEDDDAKLRHLWGEYDLAGVAAKLGRTAATTYWRAQKLGLPLGCPQGHEYLSAAAARTGYGAGQLRRILRWAGVAIKPSMARPTGAHRAFHVVVPFDVDEAITRWHQTEPLFSAAARRGMSAEAIANRLRLLADVPAKPRGKKHWRIPSDLIDRALAMELPQPVRVRGERGRYVRKVAA